MAPDTATRLKDVHPRMLVGQLDKFPHIDTRTVADDAELVGKGNLGVAAAVLRQFAEFCSLTIGGVQGAGDEMAVELLGMFRGGCVAAADDAVVMHQLMNHVSREDSLGAVGDVELALQFGSEAEDEVCHEVCGSHGGCGFDDIEVIFL